MAAVKLLAGQPGPHSSKYLYPPAALASLVPTSLSDDLSSYGSPGEGGSGRFGGGRGEGGLGSGAGAEDGGLAGLAATVPGVPGSDYPIYSEVPELEFSCADQVSRQVVLWCSLVVQVEGGRYADPAAECQVFHICVRSVTLTVTPVT